MLSRSTASEAQEKSETRFLLGPVVQRFLENVSSYPQHLSQVAHVSLDVTNAVSGQACPCTWNARYPCSLQGSCWSYSTQKTCEDAGGDFCGETGPTPSPPSPTPPTPSGGLDTEMQAALDEHNRLRAMHHAPDLTWDNALASQAQSWADHCTFEHSTLGNGENLWT